LPEWLDQRALAKRIGRTTRQLQTLAAKGLPVEPRRRGPRYDWHVVRPWWEQYLQDLVRQTVPTDEAEARTRKLAAEAELAEYKLAEQRRQIGRLDPEPGIERGKQDQIRRQRAARERSHALPTPRAPSSLRYGEEVSAAAAVAI